MEFKFKYTIQITSVNHFSPFILVKVKKNLRKCQAQAQFRKKLRKLRLRQKDGFLIKKTCRDEAFVAIKLTFAVAVTTCTQTSKLGQVGINMLVYVKVPLLGFLTTILNFVIK